MYFAGESQGVPAGKERAYFDQMIEGQEAQAKPGEIVEVPDVDAVPERLRGAVAWIRLDSTPEEIPQNRPRTRSLRTFAEHDPDFDRLYGRREDTESLNNHLKSHLWGRRAASIGFDRQRLNMRGYQLLVNVAALLAWNKRTGGDISAFLGAYKPPWATAAEQVAA